MATHNQSSHFLSLGKFGGMFFARQAAVPDAPAHRGIFAALSARIAEWREGRAAERDLSRLSDRELSDIGLTRQQIPEVVYSRR